MQPEGHHLPPGKSELQQEFERIKESITRTVFSNITEVVLERYVQYHQAGVIELADQLQSFLVKASPDEQTSLVIDFFISQLFLLLGYIERFFGKYFNNEEKLPEAYRGLIVRELSGTIDALCASVSRHIVSEPLKASVLAYLESFNSGNLPPNFNFRNLAYLKTFIEELTGMFLSAGTHDWDTELSAELIYVNFNHLAFFSYLQASVKSELEQADSAEKYRQRLRQFLSDFKSRKSKPGFSYHPQWPDLKAMLESWIQDEMLVFSPGVLPEMVQAKNEGDEKLLLQFSVAQLALLIRLF